jgi:tetratricopeptide (TPR) repeat protein
MSEHLRLARRLGIFGILILTVTARAQESTPAADPGAAEAAREVRAMERFLSLLEKNPRRGTALDKVYGYHVERGSLDSFIKAYRDRVANKPTDGTAWMILGLLENQRGQDAAAVKALQQAETTRPDDPLPLYYLGQALVLVGQPEQAAAAFERALERKPTRNDLLEIFQTLGRVYQRTQKTDQALQVWNRLEALFPNDPRVGEQIAAALAEENQPAAALPRFEALAKKATDPFRQVQLAMQAADLKVRLGRSDQALRDFETMLAKLRPDSWLHREVRRKIEEVFLRNDDQPGLVSYYEKWTKKEPEDIEALVRLGRTLAGMGRAAEAQPWFEKAIKLAPSRRDLRLALISQLAGEQKFAEAVAQYEALDQSEPNNPDTLRDWGALLLRDNTKPASQRKAAAAVVWRKMLIPKPNDPVTTAQVADLLRQAELTEDALALYRKAADLAPANPQYHEYIGEYLHNLKRPDDAKAAWAKIAEGTNKNAKNLARLAEVLAGFGYLKEAVAPLTEAVTFDRDNFDYHLKLADYLHRLERYDAAETEISAARKLAEKAEEKVAVLEARVKNDQAADRVAKRIDVLQKELHDAKDPTAEQWDILARYLEADAKLPEAVHAADNAIAIEPRSIPAWTLAARVRESAGNLNGAAEALRRLAEIDRRNRTEHLTGIAKLESRLGRIDAAIKAGRDLLAAAPGNPEHYEFFAQLCFQLGKPDEGLDALRRAVRFNPNDTKITLTLAETLADQFQTVEAIEQYWRAFDRASDLDDKLGVVRRLTELYLQRNQLDRLFTRLQHSDREDRPAIDATGVRERDVALCVSQALATSGDLGGARSELERLLAANKQDPHLLGQLSKLAEEEGDIESAARYQKQLNELAPSDEGASRLAQLYARVGEIDEAQAVWSTMAAGKSGTYRAYQAIDSLLANQKARSAVEITDAMMRKDPGDWEALYRSGVAFATLEKPEEAIKRFRALLALRIDDDEKSSFAKARARNPRLQATVARGVALPGAQGEVPLEQRIGITFLIRRACNTVGTTRTIAWSPDDYGQARMAALGWLIGFEQKHNATAASAIAAIESAAAKTPADVHALWDWFYLCQMRYDNAGLFAVARKLSRAAKTDPIALWAYLHVMGGRDVPLGTEFVFSQIPSLLRQLTNPTSEDGARPLDKAELDHVMACYHSLRARRPDLAEALVLVNVSDELKGAKRLAEEERFFRDAIAGATRIGQVAGAFVLAARRGDAEGLIQLFERYDRVQTGRSQSRLAYSTQTFSFVGPGLAMSQGMSVLADRKEYAEVLRLVDFSMAFARRKQQQQSAGAAMRALRARYAAMGYAGSVPVSYSIWIGRRNLSVQIPFPQVNEYFDATLIQVLRTAYELYNRSDLSSDLVAHFRRQTAAAKGPRDAIYPALALSSVLWWNDQKDEAIAELTKVVDAGPAESELRLELAELLEEQRVYADALAVVDAVQPLDNMTLRRREELALRVALSSGEVERARKAAQRLFGLRLDTDTQVRLAGQMQQLGLHELADAVLGRARRRAGNKAEALVALMLQYERQGKHDESAQVALQVLRSSASAGQATTARAVNDSEAARTAAIGVLAGSGRLPKLIERATSALQKAPNSVQIHQTLVDYYTAAKDEKKASIELVKLANLRPDDTRLRLQVAYELARSGQIDLALGHYNAVFKKDPTSFARAFRQIETMLLQSGRVADLIRLLEDIDLNLVGNGLTVGRLIQDLPERPGLDEQVRSLFRKTWDTFPEQRVQLLVYVHRDDIWRMPDIYERVCEAIIPQNVPPPTPALLWYSFMPVGPFTNPASGSLSTRIIRPPITRLLDLAASQGRL